MIVTPLSQPEKTSPGLLVLKTSSKSGLPIAWITGRATIPQPPGIVINKTENDDRCMYVA